jgi:hypothetical protein
MLEEVKKWRKMLPNISKNVDKKYVGKLPRNVDEERKMLATLPENVNEKI